MEELSKSHSFICVRLEHVNAIREKLKEIREKFHVSLKEVSDSKAKSDCGTNSMGLSVVFFKVEKGGDASLEEVSQIAGRVQCFVDALCVGIGEHGDDSSYDSDTEADGDLGDCHQDVSRTASETLAAEYADYVCQGDRDRDRDRDREALASRLEFGLRLGYTEPLVRAALRRLGPQPAQNELLAELIRQAATAPKQALPQPAGPEDDAAPAAPSPPALLQAPRPRLRPIVIDGSNVAMSHGNKEVFSCRGIRICVDWFRARGHTEITVFVPKWRKEAARPDNLVTEQAILGELERERLLVYTPSRLVSGKRLVCYDDRYVLRLAADTGGVVVSNDNYRDLAQENADFRLVVEERLLMYSFVNDRFMPPEDPLGRSGPSLDAFLRLPAARADQQAPPCPYAKKCTYGNKCKFSHPERGQLPHKSVTERLAEQAQAQLQAAGLRPPPGQGKQLKGKSLSLPLDAGAVRKSPLTRSQSNAPPGPPGAAASALGAALQHKAKAVCKSYSLDGGGAAAPAGGGDRGDAAAEARSPANLHRPLQRQLSLNPAYDARLLHMRRAMGLSAEPGLGLSASSAPGGAPLLASPLGLAHSAVTRIASAPDSHHKWAQPLGRLSRGGGGGGVSGSDSQLNAATASLASSASVPAYEWSQALYNHQAQQVRQRLHYHLASIFPEELVATAMALYPDEVDPQKICTAILVLQSEAKS